MAQRNTYYAFDKPVECKKTIDNPKILRSLGVNNKFAPLTLNHLCNTFAQVYGRPNQSEYSSSAHHGVMKLYLDRLFPGQVDTMFFVPLTPLPTDLARGRTLEGIIRRALALEGKVMNVVMLHHDDTHKTVVQCYKGQNLPHEFNTENLPGMVIDYVHLTGCTPKPIIEKLLKHFKRSDPYPGLLQRATRRKHFVSWAVWAADMADRLGVEWSVSSDPEEDAYIVGRVKFGASIAGTGGIVVGDMSMGSLYNMGIAQQVEDLVSKYQCMSLTTIVIVAPRTGKKRKHISLGEDPVTRVLAIISTQPDKWSRLFSALFNLPLDTEWKHKKNTFTYKHSTVVFLPWGSAIEAGINVFVHPDIDPMRFLAVLRHTQTFKLLEDNAIRISPDDVQRIMANNKQRVQAAQSDIQRCFARANN